MPVSAIYQPKHRTTALDGGKDRQEERPPPAAVFMPSTSWFIQSPLVVLNRVSIRFQNVPAR